jgi:hypothetical protein
LDQYFLLERIHTGNALIRKELPITVLRTSSDEVEVGSASDPRYFRAGPIPVHESWSNADLERFRAPTPERFFGAVGAPDRLFPFDRFCELFFRQVVPTQAVWRPDLPLLASPTRVSIFGRP